jgi:protein TonB
LKRVFQRNWMLGLLIAVMIHMTVIGSYFLVGLFSEEEPPLVRVRIMRYTDLPPPPSIMSSNVPPPVSISAPVAKPSIGAPVPVPDAEVSAEQTIATQREMSEAPAPFIEGSTGGDVVEVQPNIVIDDSEPPADFVPVEKEPVVVRRVEPTYPELAIRAGLEGRVWVKIWVGKDGKVRDVVIVKSDAEIFNEPCIVAAKQCVFTPAYMNSGPVSVWVTFPYTFQIRTTNR